MLKCLSFFFESSVESVLWLLLKTNFSFYRFLSKPFVFRFYTTFTALDVLWQIIGKHIVEPNCWWVRWCQKCVLIYEDWKKLDFLEVHRSLGPGVRMSFRCKWRKLDSLLFSIILLVNINCIVNSNEIFCSMGQVPEWSFLVLHVFWVVCNWDLKLNWPRKYWLLSFLSDCALFFRRHICMDKNLQGLLNCVCLSTTWNI